MAGDFDTAVLEIAYDAGAGEQTVRVSNRPVAGSPTIEVRLAGLPEYDVKIGLWIWSTRTKSAFADAEIINADGKLDWLLDADVRDRPAILYLGRTGEPFTSFVQRAKLVSDFVPPPTTSRRIRLAFKSPDIKLQKTFQTDFYEPGVAIPSLEGQPVPMMIGQVTQAPLVLVQEAPDAELDCHVMAPAVVDEVAASGNPAFESQYELRDRGIRMLVNTSGKLTIDASGIQKQSGHTTADLPAAFPDDYLNIDQNANFNEFDGDKPTGYTLAFDDVASPEKKIERYFFEPRLRIVNRDSSLSGLLNAAPRMAIDLGLIPGRWYAIRLVPVDVAGWTNQVASLVIKTAAAGTEGDNTHVAQHVNGVTMQGISIFYFQAGGPVLKVIFGGPLFTTVDTEIRLGNMRLWDVEASLVELKDLVPYALSQAAWDGGTDTAELDALSAEIGPHVMGDYLTETVRTDDLIDRMLATFLAWRYVDETGVLRFGRLMDPADIPGDPVLTIRPESIREGESVQVSDDLMPGLTDVFGGKKNQTRLDESTTNGVVSLKDSAERAAEYRLTARGSAEELHPFYRWAHDRFVYDSGLQDETSLALARDRVVAQAAVMRRFWVVKLLRTQPGGILPGQKVRIIWPGYGAENGIDTQILGVKMSYLNHRIELICRG